MVWFGLGFHFDVKKVLSKINLWLYVLQALGLVIQVLCLVKQPVLVDQSLAR